MPSDDPQAALRDIIQNIDHIERFTRGLDEQAFREQEQTVYAVQYALLVISEAARRLGPRAESLCPGAPWADIRGLGNWLRHGYDRIARPRIWRTVTMDLPVLKTAAEEALQRLPPPGPKPGQ